jgi:hypothetical protein
MLSGMVIFKCTVLCGFYFPYTSINLSINFCSFQEKVEFSSYCNVPGVLFTMDVYFHSKNSTHYSYIKPAILQTHVGRLLSDVPHKTPTGPLLVISQHRLTFLQSESLQTQVRAQPLCSSGTNSHSCNQEASKHTCFSRNFPILSQSSNQQESVAKHACLHSVISKHGLPTNQ